VGAGARLQAVIAGLVGRPWFWIAVISVPFGWPIYLSLTNKTPLPIPVVGNLASFSTKDQNGKPLASADLEHRAWVMNFAALDDPATDASIKSLEKVQYRARNLGQTFGLITWVLDGSVPGRVADYVKQRPISPRMWWFVPETPPEVASSARDAIAKAVGGPLSPSDEKKLATGNTLFLVDPASRLRGIYDASDPDSLDKLLHDAGLIINRGY